MPFAGKALDLFDGEQPEVLTGRRVMVRRMKAHHNFVEMAMILGELKVYGSHLANRFLSRAALRSLS